MAIRIYVPFVVRLWGDGESKTVRIDMVLDMVAYQPPGTPHPWPMPMSNPSPPTGVANLIAGSDMEIVESTLADAVLTITFKTAPPEGGHVEISGFALY